MLERKVTLATSALAALGLWTCVLVAPPAAALPVVEFYVDGLLFDSYTCGNPEFDCVTDPKVDEFFLFLQDPGGAWDVTITASLDPDPQIAYGVAVIDHGAANTFGFSFLQDIVSVLAPGTASHEYSASNADGQTANGATVTPGAPPVGISQDGPDQGPLPDEIAVFSLSTTGDASYLNAGLDLGPAFTAPSGGSTNQPGLSASGPGPAGSGSYDQMRVDVNVILGGDGETYSSNGTATVLVPEPLSMALLGLGLAALGFVGRRRS